MLKTYSYLSAAILCLLLVGSAESAIAAKEVLKAGTYIIQMYGSDMTVAATSEAKNSNMILWPYRPTATWFFRHMGDNVYMVQSNSTMLDGSKGTKSGGQVTITPSKTGTGQRWILKREGKYYKFINEKTGLAMTLDNGKRARGSQLVNKAVADSQDQLFCIQRSTDPPFCGEKGYKTPEIWDDGASPQIWEDKAPGGDRSF